MRSALLWLAGPACLVVALLVAAIFELSFQSVILLAPLIVLTAAALVAFGLLFARAAIQNLRGEDSLDDVDGNA
jgi:type IV secretory pathway protease TraF